MLEVAEHESRSGGPERRVTRNSQVETAVLSTHCLFIRFERGTQTRVRQSPLGSLTLIGHADSVDRKLSGEPARLPPTQITMDAPHG